MTKSAQKAMEILRDPSLFQWYIIPIFVFVIYLYYNEIHNKQYSAVLAGLAFWGMDWFNEIWNALVLHFTNYAPVWGAPGKTALLIFVGLNIEITLMFATLGLASTKVLSDKKDKKILGINNRWFFAITNSIFAVLVEEYLHYAGALTWEYSWWNTGTPWLIFLIGYLPFFLVAYWVYDMKEMKNKIFAVTGILSFDAICIIIFSSILKWV